MDDRITELLYRNLQEVFGEGDASRRRAAIRDFYTEDCVLYVPPGIFVGHDALDKFAGDLRATHPHFVYTPRGEPQALHNGGILAWGSGPNGEALRRCCADRLNPPPESGHYRALFGCPLCARSGSRSARDRPLMSKVPGLPAARLRSTRRSWPKRVGGVAGLQAHSRCRR
jgi:hypothetical protein